MGFITTQRFCLPYFTLTESTVTGSLPTYHNQHVSSYVTGALPMDLPHMAHLLPTLPRQQHQQTATPPLVFLPHTMPLPISLLMPLSWPNYTTSSLTLTLTTLCHTHIRLTARQWITELKWKSNRGKKREEEKQGKVEKGRGEGGARETDEQEEKRRE